MKLRLWSDLYLIQGRYIVIMGTPIKASSLNDLNGLDVYPSLYGSLPLMSNRFPRLSTDLTSFVLPSHNQGVGLAFKQDHCPQEKIPTDYQLIFCTSLLILTHFCYSTFRRTLPVTLMFSIDPMLLSAQIPNA
jgi:hypothetical protein